MLQVLQQKMTAHNHPILVKILESQASMRLSMGNWWSPRSRKRLTIHHQNSKKFLLGVAFAYSYPKLILPVQDGLTFMKQMKKPSMSSPIPQKSMGPEPVSTFFLPVHKISHNQMASSVAKMNASCCHRSQTDFLLCSKN